jgi:hypothetical protein
METDKLKKFMPSAEEVQAINSAYEDFGIKFLAVATIHAKWSRHQFGGDYAVGPEGPAAHLVKEAEELRANPFDRMEMADVLLLLLDVSRRAGVSPEKLVEAAQAKLKINMLREWQPPDAVGVSHHVRAEVPKITCDSCGYSGAPDSAQIQKAMLCRHDGTLVDGGKAHNGRALLRCTDCGSVGLDWVMRGEPKPV